MIATITQQDAATELVANYLNTIKNQGEFVINGKHINVYDKVKNLISYKVNLVSVFLQMQLLINMK